MKDKYVMVAGFWMLLIGLCLGFGQDSISVMLGGPANPYLGSGPMNMAAMALKLLGVLMFVGALSSYKNLGLLPVIGTLLIIPPLNFLLQIGEIFGVLLILVGVVKRSFRRHSNPSSVLSTSAPDSVPMNLIVTFGVVLWIVALMTSSTLVSGLLFDYRLSH